MVEESSTRNIVFIFAIPFGRNNPLARHIREASQTVTQPRFAKYFPQCNEPYTSSFGIDIRRNAYKFFRQEEIIVPIAALPLCRECISHILVAHSLRSSGYAPFAGAHMPGNDFSLVQAVAFGKACRAYSMHGEINFFSSEYVSLRMYSPVCIQSFGCCSFQLPALPILQALTSRQGVGEMNLQIKSNAALEISASASAKLQKCSDTNSTERNDPPSLSLDECGLIQGCSKSFEALFGFRHNDLVLHHVSMLYPQLTGVELIQAGQLNPLLNYLCRCGHLYQTQNRQGDTFSSKLSFVFTGYDRSRSLKMIVQPSGNANT
jgi:hypothetical protein